jgi:HEAT repeat protein
MAQHKKLVLWGAVGTLVLAALASGGIWWFTRPKRPAISPQMFTDLERLDAQDPIERARTIDKLARQGPPAIPALRTRLTGQHGAGRQGVVVGGPRGEAAAAEALGRIGPAAIEAAPELVVHLNGKNKEDWLPFYDALLKLGPQAIPAVRAELKKEEYARKGFTDVLSDLLDEFRIQSDDKAAQVQELVAILKEHGSRTPEKVLDALAELGPPAKQAAPLLRDLLKNESSDTRRRAARALASIEPGNADAQGVVLKAVREEVSPGHSCSPHRTDQDLKILGLKATELVPLLEQKLERDDSVDAARWLARIQPGHPKVVPALLAIVRNTENPERPKRAREVRGQAAKALSDITPATPETLKALKQAAATFDQSAESDAFFVALDRIHIAMPAAFALVKLEPKSAEGLTILRRGIAKDNEFITRLEAAKLLGQLGPQAAPALKDVLDRLPEEWDYPVRRELIETAYKIDPVAAAQAGIGPSVRPPSKPENRD